MNRTQRLSQRVIEYYADNAPVASQIMHTQSVAHFARLIAEAEGLDSKTCEMMEEAAWLHDIGCPQARQKYGDSKPPHQECEGKRMVHEWLDNDPDFTAEETSWLADAVGGHHRVTEAHRLHFEPLFEADLIVNLFEGYYKPDMAQHFVNSGAVSTSTGLALFEKLFSAK